MTQALGKGCLLAKLDLKEAYRAVPVHPSDQRLIAVQWNGETYIDRALPFGLCSAPKLFSALTDAMMWFLYERGSPLLGRFPAPRPSELGGMCSVSINDSGSL